LRPPPTQTSTCSEVLDGPGGRRRGAALLMGSGSAMKINER
jgi:hypothetical protein